VELKTKRLGPAGEDGFEQGEGGSGVVAEVDFGLLHGFAGFDEGGEVEHAVKGNVCIGSLAKKTFDSGAIGDIGFNKFDAMRDEVAAGVAEVIYNTT
jgi:hypothetical protein